MQLGMRIVLGHSCVISVFLQVIVQAAFMLAGNCIAACWLEPWGSQLCVAFTCFVLSELGT